MRRIIAVIAVLAVAAAWTIAGPKPAASEDGIAVYFSPKGGCTDAIVHEMGNAQVTLIVQADGVASPRIREAMLDAHKRGVFVHVVVHALQRNFKFTKWFVDHDIPILLDAEHRMAHAVIVIDGETIITGNFGRVPRGGQGELLIITGKPRLARAYLNNIDEHRDHSEVSPFEPPPLP